MSLRNLGIPVVLLIGLGARTDPGRGHYPHAEAPGHHDALREVGGHAVEAQPGGVGGDVHQQCGQLAGWDLRALGWILSGENVGAECQPSGGVIHHQGRRRRGWAWRRRTRSTVPGAAGEDEEQGQGQSTRGGGG